MVHQRAWSCRRRKAHFVDWRGCRDLGTYGPLNVCRDACSSYRAPSKFASLAQGSGSGAAADARHGPMSGGAGLASTIWASSKKKAPAHDHNTTLKLSLACERRTPWPASAAVERPRCTPTQRLFLQTAPRALPTTPSAMAAGTLPDMHMAAVEGGTGQRLGHAVIIVAGVCSLMASLTTFV